MAEQMQSLWRGTASAPSYPTLEGTHNADVVIVGGGITGITTAALLAREGKRVIVIDGHTIAGSVTSGTTAHITPALDVRYYVVANGFGAEGARLAAQSHMAAVAQIESLVRDHSIECGFERLSGYLYTESSDDEAMLEKEFKAMLNAGLAVSLTNNTGLPFPVKLAIKVENQAQFHPLQYVYTLAERIAAQGVNIYEHSKMVKIEDNDDGVRVETENGAIITATDAFMATHIPPGLNIVDTQVAPYRSYVIACKTADQYPHGLFWDTEDPYHYTRIYEQDGQRWLVIGGNDHKVGQNEDTEASYADLEAYIRAHYNITSMEYRWSSQVYEPADKLAYIGKSPGAKHYYYASGYGGHGMLYSNVAARLVTDLIVGRKNPYEDLYSPSRIKPLASAADYIKENINAVAHLIGDRFKSEADSIGEVMAGEGKVVQVGGQQVAAYRDDAGTLHTVTAVCTHLKCIVDWNTAEKTWDCPCHGGRFEATGEWIEGPPLHGLEPVDMAKLASEGGGS